MSEKEKRTNEELREKLELLGNELRVDCQYSIGGMDAIYCYLINKHHWLPKDVISMTPAELTIALLNEIHDKLPM